MRHNIETIAEKFNLDLLVLFGSEVSGLKHAESDLDIAYFCQNDLTTDQYEALSGELISFYHRGDIDLVPISIKTSPLLNYEILSTGKILFEKRNGLLDRLKWQSYFDMEDFKKYYTMQSQLIDIRLNKLAS